MKQIFRYLQHTRDYWLQYYLEEMILFNFCNANWGNNLDMRKSTTGFTFLLNNVIITWSNWKQPMAALSTTKAEYMAMSQANCEAIWLQRFLSELGFNQKEATTISTNSQGNLALIKNLVHHRKTKHINIHHHYVHDMVVACKIKFEYCPLTDMNVDILMKPLLRLKHWQCMKWLGLWHSKLDPWVGMLNVKWLNWISHEITKV